MEAFLDGVLERARAVAEAAEVFAVTQREIPVRFEANRLKSVQTRETSGVALRLIKDGRLGFASTTRLEDPQALVDAALEVAPFGAEAHFAFPAPQEYTPLASHDPVIAGLPVETLVDWGNAVIAGVREVNADILVEAGFSKDISTTIVRNSSGGGGSFDKTAFAVWVWANLVRDTDMLDVYEWHATGQGLPDLDALVAAVTEKVRLAERNVSVATRPMPVVFTPKGFSMTMLDSLEKGFSGKLVLEGASPLTDKLGHVAFDARFRLVDDGLVAESPASAPFDDEGMPTRCTPLVENGVVQAFLYDLQTAGRAGVQSTGNASRDLDSLPSPGSHAWRVEPGEASLADMLSGIDEGLLVDQVMGAWAGNVVAGEFSGNVHLGYKIEKGELVGRVKDTMVAGNVYAALKEKLGAVGDTGLWVGGTLWAPHLMFTSLGVASKE